MFIYLMQAQATLDCLRYAGLLALSSREYVMTR